MLPDRLEAAGVTGPDVGRLQREGSLVAGGAPVTLEEMSEPRRGQVFAFVMDTRLCDAAFALADGADILVCESTFLDATPTWPPLRPSHGGPGGPGWRRRRARRLVLSHFSQRYPTPRWPSGWPGKRPRPSAARSCWPGDLDRDPGPGPAPQRGT